MTPTVAIIFRAALGVAVVIVAGFAVVLLVGGTVGTRIARRRDDRDPTREVGSWEDLTQPDWTADRPMLIWASSPLLLDWLIQYGGPADNGVTAGVDYALPNATVRYIYPDEQAIDVSTSVLVARDVVPEWSAGPLTWASDADVDGHTYDGPQPPAEEGRDVTDEVNAWNLRQAEITQLNATTDDLGLDTDPAPVLDDRVPVSPWDSWKPGSGQAVPVKPQAEPTINGSPL